MGKSKTPDTEPRETYFDIATIAAKIAKRIRRRKGERMSAIVDAASTPLPPLNF